MKSESLEHQILSVIRQTDPMWSMSDFELDLETVSRALARFIDEREQKLNHDSFTAGFNAIRTEHHTEEALDKARRKWMEGFETKQ
jgi:hypothetical protein